MKKIFVVISIFTLFLSPVAFGQTGGQCFVAVPGWVLAGGAGDGLTAAGRAKVEKGGMQFARAIATGYAKDEMARRIDIKTKNVLRDFTRSTGVGDNDVAERVAVFVSARIADNELQRVAEKAIWLSPCDDLFVLIELNASAVRAAIQEAIAAGYRTEGAVWQQFQSSGAREQLNRAMDNEFPQ